MKSDKTLTEFCEQDAPAYAAYDNIRKIASYLDGLKLSQRKVIYTMLKKFPDPSSETKTARLASNVAETTEYLHGEGSLCTVLDTMAASFVGSNNYPLIKGNGNFGTRFSGPGSAAAERYTYCSISPLTALLIPDVMRKLCPSQIFEGSEIEPEFYLPIFPILFLNGTDGISSGWKASIYPRNPKEILDYIIQCLKARKANTKVSDKIKRGIEISAPFFRGFAGKTIYEIPDGATEGSFVNYGCIRKIHSTLMEITEIPITYNYSSYIKFLDKLQEKEELFVDYEDNCDPKSDTFTFKIKVKRDFWNKYPDEKDWIKLFGLQKTLSEQLNCIGEGGKVVEFKNIREILDAYIEKRLEYYDKQKNYLIQEYTSKLEIDISKYVFVSGVSSGSIQIGNKKIDEINDILDKVDRIKRVDQSYSYLLAMPMRSMTKETLDKLKQEMLGLKDSILTLNQSSIEDMWLDDLKGLKKHLGV